MAKVTLPYSQDYYSEELQACADDITPLSTLVEDAITRSREFLLSLQHPDGYWWAELEANATITAQTLLIYKILGIEDEYPLHKIEHHIRRTQRDHGGWEMFDGDGGYLSATIESYMALCLLNVPKTDPALQRAHKVIIEGGGVSKSRMFTKICLALIGCYDWKGIPSIPAWLMLVPSWFPVTIYDTACWARGCVVPLIIIFDHKPVFKITPEVSFDELYAEGRENARFSVSDLAPACAGDWRAKFFVGVDYVFKAMEKMGMVPFRQRGRKEAEKWLLERQEDSGDFLGVYPPMFYSIVCMKALGYEVTNPVLHRALSSLKVFTVETRDEWRVQSALSPVWDTALAVRSLIESGMKPDHPALQKAGEWLLQKQITKHGDWSYRNPSTNAGGWAFQFFNRWYPDVDDSAAVLMALHALKMPNESIKNGAIAYGVEWIRNMQCKKGGGWAAYDVDHDKYWLNDTPFGDLKAMIDNNTLDVTARVVEMVGRLKDVCMEGATPLFPAEAIVRGLAYIRNEQEKEGCWYGRWGINYIYGTCGALVALSQAAPPKTHEEVIRRGAKWLVEVQNKKQHDFIHGKANANMANGYSPLNINSKLDGGWGETCFSHVDAALKGKNDHRSTKSQTAWALQGLLAAGDALGEYEAESIKAGVEYLVRTQRKDGSWQESQFTGGGFPGHFYLRYHFYAQHFTLSALSRYKAHRCQLQG